MLSVSLPPPIRKLKLCYVTDRKALAGSAEEQVRWLLGRIEDAARTGVDWVQIREKDLSGRELMELVKEALRRVPASCRILVNDRLDVACVAGAGGVHLGEQSLPVEEARLLLRDREFAEDFLLGVSAHSMEAARAAEANRADYVIFGPVFPTPSKLAYGLPQGVEKLGDLCRSLSIPVIAIGGITAENVRACVEAGATGIAAIRLFQDSQDVAAAANSLRLMAR
jgi:thiamine-phosphate pyrophosphorylase